MKFDGGIGRAEKIRCLELWHRWFAWYPVRIAPHDCRWLEYVMRRNNKPISQSERGEWIYQLPKEG